jgi:hypothetical protein
MQVEMQSAIMPNQELLQPRAAVYASGVYRAGGEALTPELIRIEHVEQGVGRLATGEAVGMAALPEQYADQQLHRFNFTRDQYAAARAQEAATIRAMEAQFNTDDDEESDASERRR